MTLDSKLNFHSHIREAIIKAGKGIGIIRFFSKYVLCDVLDQIYKFYVRSNFDYGDIIYHKYDPEFKLESTQYAAVLALSGAWYRTNTDKLYEELGRGIFTTGCGIDACVTFTNCEMIRYPLNLFSEIPQERTLHYSLRRPSAYEPHVKSTERFSHTYF